MPGSCAAVSCRWSHSVTARGSGRAVRAGPPPGSWSRQVPYPPGGPLPVPVPGGPVAVPGGLLPVPGGPLPCRVARCRCRAARCRAGWPAAGAGWLPGGRRRGFLVRRGLPGRPGVAQPWAVGWPCWSVMVMHQVVAGLPVAWAARVRARAASMGPYPAASPGLIGEAEQGGQRDGQVDRRGRARRPGLPGGASLPRRQPPRRVLRAAGLPTPGSAPGAPGRRAPLQGSRAPGLRAGGLRIGSRLRAAGLRAAGGRRAGGRRAGGRRAAGSASGRRAAGRRSRGAAAPGAPAPACCPPGAFVPGACCGGAGVHAEQGVQVGAGAELVHGAGQPGGLQRQRGGGDGLVGGQRRVRRQTVPADRRGAGILAPQLHPRILLRFPAASPGRLGVGFQHRPADRRADLPRRLPGHRARHHGGLGFGGGGIIQDAGGLGDQLRLIVPDDPRRQRLPGAGQPGGQVMRQRDHPLRRPPGHRQRDRELIGAVPAPHGRLPGPGRGGGAGSGRAAGGQLSGRGQPPRRGPRLGFRPAGQHPDQLIIIQPPMTAAGGRLQRPGQRRARHRACRSRRRRRTRTGAAPGTGSRDKNPASSPPPSTPFGLAAGAPPGPVAGAIPGARRRAGIPAASPPARRGRASGGSSAPSSGQGSPKSSAGHQSPPPAGRPPGPGPSPAGCPPPAPAGGPPGAPARGTSPPRCPSPGTSPPAITLTPLTSITSHSHSLSNTISKSKILEKVAALSGRDAPLEQGNAGLGNGGDAELEGKEAGLERTRARRVERRARKRRMPDPERGEARRGPRDQRRKASSGGADALAVPMMGPVVAPRWIRDSAGIVHGILAIVTSGLPTARPRSDRRHQRRAKGQMA